MEDEREIEVEGIWTCLIRIIDCVMDILKLWTNVYICSFDVFLVVICMCLAKLQSENPKEIRPKIRGKLPKTRKKES